MPAEVIQKIPDPNLLPADSAIVVLLFDVRHRLAVLLPPAACAAPSAVNQVRAVGHLQLPLPLHEHSR